MSSIKEYVRNSKTEIFSLFRINNIHRNVNDNTAKELVRDIF